MQLKAQTRMTLIFSALSACILLLSLFVLQDTFVRQSEQQTKEALRKQSTLIQHTLGHFSTPLNRQDGFDRIADRIGEDLQLRITLIAADGQVLGDSELDGEALQSMENQNNRPEIIDTIKSGFGESKRFSPTLKKEMLFVAKAFVSPQGSGILRLALPLSELSKISDQLKRASATGLFFIFIFAVLLNYGAARILSTPFRTLSNITKQIKRGQFSKIKSRALEGEVGALAGALDELADQLQIRLKDQQISRSHLEAVLLSMQEGVLLVSPSRHILLMNKTLKDFFQITSIVKGQKALEVIRNIEVNQIIDDSLQSAEPLPPRELLVLGQEQIRLSVSATPISREGKQEGAILIFHDNTALRRLEHLRRDFVANVSHELKTPITSIKGYAETLLEGALDDAKVAREFTEIIFSDAERLANLVHDLLNLSKIESGKINLEIKACALDPIVEKVVNSTKAQADRKSMTLEIAPLEALPQMLADDTRMIQVLSNLIDNAIKYTPEGGTIKLSALEGEKDLHITLEDDGIGISKEDQERIFERFYRADKGRSRQLGGTGLGLSIVKHIIKAHQGEISVSSQLGQGTRFTFTIPKAKRG